MTALQHLAGTTCRYSGENKQAAPSLWLGDAVGNRGVMALISSPPTAALGWLKRPAMGLICGGVLLI
jgi:hypothetical protein